MVTRRDPTIIDIIKLSFSVRKNPHILIMGKRCCHFFSAVFDRILFILAGNDDIHKSFDEFDIPPNLTMDYRVNCP